jgi:hypothetical protein
MKDRKILSNSLRKMQVSEIGRKPSIVFAEGSFGIGKMVDSFQRFGDRPVTAHR